MTEHIEPVPQDRHTYCVTDHVDNPSLRAAMSIFDENLDERWRFAGRAPEQLSALFSGSGPMVLLVWGNPDCGKSDIVRQYASRFVQEFDADMPTWLQVPESASDPETVSETSTHTFDDVVEVVRDIQHRLGVDLKDVLAAASIKPRTYHSWTQPSAPRPRLASQGRLWALAQLVDDLPEILDVPLRQWLLADPERLMILRAGCFDELLEQASQERMPHDPTGTVAGPFHGVGGDSVGEDSPPSPRTTRRELVIDERAITEPALPPRGSPELPRR